MQDKWDVPDSEIANDGDIGAGQTDRSINILDDNTDELQDTSGCGVASGGDNLAAHITGRGRWAVIVLLDRASDEDTADGDELKVD
jgi:hypothetical protein